MARKLKAYYIPDGLRDLESDFEYTEITLDRYIILFPRLDPEQIIKIAKYVKDKAIEIYRDTDNIDVSEIVQKLRDKWINENYERFRLALDLLPQLTGLSKEVIILYQFGTIKKLTKETVKFFKNLNPPREVLSKFILLDDAEVWLRGFSSIFNKIKFSKAIKQLKKPKLVTFITPSNVPGLIEALGVFLALVGQTSMIIKTPSKQPVFGPLFAESLKEINRELAETIAVLPWRGGDETIEIPLFRESDAVSIVGSTESARAVKEKVDSLRRKGFKVKGSYHGGKFGLNVISREFVRGEVAALSVIDGIGYEGYMCSSPAFGFFVEDSGDGSARKFAEMMFEEAQWISEIVPQSDLFKRYRKRTLSHYLALENTGKAEVLISEKNNFAVVYLNESKLIPDGQNRLFKVYPIKNIYDVIKMMGTWRDYLQTVGVAIPNKEMFNFAEEAAKIGFSNIRVVGTVTLPRLGESWDGYYPLLEFMIDGDYVHWVTINAKDIEEEIKHLSSKLDYLRKGDLLSFG